MSKREVMALAVDDLSYDFEDPMVTRIKLLCDDDGSPQRLVNEFMVIFARS